MSECELKIGSLDDSTYTHACIAHLASIGMVKKSFVGTYDDQNTLWQKAPKNIDSFFLMNLATVCFFLDHVASLEGITNAEACNGKTKFPNLPWYMESIWLPVKFSQHKVPLLKDSYIFLGSCNLLLEELEKVQELSDIDLGMPPKGYKEMRTNFDAFYRSDFEIESENEILQWVWKGLYDGVKTALEHNAPMSAFCA